MDLLHELSDLVFKRPMVLFMTAVDGRPLARTVENMEQLSRVLEDVAAGIIIPKCGVMSIENQMWFHLAVVSGLVRSKDAQSPSI